MTGESVSTHAGICLSAGMDFSMSFEIVSSYEAFLAVVTSELSVTKMGLNVGLNVFFSAEALVAVFVLADPLSVIWQWSLDELSNVVECDVGFFDGSADTWLELEI